MLRHVRFVGAAPAWAPKPYRLVATADHCITKHIIFYISHLYRRDIHGVYLARGIAVGVVISIQCVMFVPSASGFVFKLNTGAFTKTTYQLRTPARAETVGCVSHYLLSQAAGVYIQSHRTPVTAPAETSVECMILAHHVHHPKYYA